ncbi:MAG: MFS transporter, partial [Thermoplasmata archaeon]
SGHESSDFGIPWNDRIFITVCLLISLIFFVSGQWGTTLTLFWSMVDHVGNGMIGILYSVNGLIVVFLQLPIIRIIKRFGSMTQIAIGGLIYSVSFFALAFFSSFTFLIIDVIVITIGENVISPVAMNIVGQMAPVEKRGQYYGTFQLMNGMISPLAPVMGTALLYRYMAYPVLLWGIILVIGISISSVVYFFGKTLLSARKNTASNNSGI